MIGEIANTILNAAIEYRQYQDRKTKPVEPKDQRPRLQALHRGHGK